MLAATPRVVPLIVLAAVAAGCGDHHPAAPAEEVVVEIRDAALTPGLAASVDRLLAELDTIPAGRRERLEELAAFISARVEAGEPARLTFICTHNSRRSHMAQVWAQTAAHAFGVPGVETYSGGTEATAFNPRAVAALERAGFLVEVAGPSDNPVYGVQFAEDAEPMACFSKVFDRAPNPSAGFAAVMTCSAADAACPLVPGADERIAITYEDPKAFDGTAREAAAYDERCRQIAREMLWAFARVRDRV